MKKILALILCFSLIFAFAACGNDTEPSTDSTPSTAAPIPGITDFSATPSEGLAYDVNDDGVSCTVTGIGECTDQYIYVGDEIDGYAVTAVGPAAFYCNPKIMGVQFGDSVTSVGDYAFFDCGSLKTVILGDGIITLGEYAFAGCKMKAISIPESMETIAQWAFYDCFLLEEVRISDLDRWLAISFGGSYANPLQCAGSLYVDDVLLTELTIPQEQLRIGQWAFAGCTSLTQVSFHENVAAISQRAFMDCDNLKTILFAGTVDQWNALEKGSYWNFHLKDLIITCTDGEA